MKVLGMHLKRLFMENLGDDCMVEIYFDRIVINDYETYDICILESNGLFNLYVDKKLELKEVSRGDIKNYIRNFIETI